MPAAARPCPLNLTPTPVTAALAGAFSAIALPAFQRWTGASGDFGADHVIGFLLLVALPAHAGVLGLVRAGTPGARRVDRPLLTRGLVWLGAAVAVSLLARAWS